MDKGTTQPLHIVFTLANNSSAPYFNWFAERSFQDHNIKLSFVCLYPEKPKMIEDVGQYGCDCHWVKYDFHDRKKGLLRAAYEMYKIFKKIKPDVVHSHLFDDALPAMLASRLAGVKIRANTRGDASYHYYYAPTWFIFDKFNNWNSTHIVAISEECKDFVLEKEKANPQKVTRIHHGIPIKQFTTQSETDKAFLLDTYELRGKKIIGTVSRLIEWKGYRYIIEAAREVVKNYPNTVFLFVGTGDQKKELEILVEEYNLSKNIIFTGWMDRKLIPSFYGILDVYVHAASNEPFGFVIAEAMMNGTPVVSTKTGAALDAITHKENGYLVDMADSQGIAEGIHYIFTQDTAELRKKSIDTALKLYGFERMWDDYMQFYTNDVTHT
jgi:glycosyltransferase involved in cell wall biosynthesis